MRITIIGGGPGGYTAAFAAAQRGVEVTLVENSNLGGTCLNCGCIPTKTLRATADALELSRRLAEYGVTGGSSALDLDAVRRRKDSVIKILVGGLEKACAHHKVTLLRGMGRLQDAHTVVVRSAEGEVSVSSDAVILATGSRVLELPGLAFDHTVVCSSDDALQLTRIPRRLVIVGGGVIGCEMACIYQAFGSEVTVVEGLDRLLPLPSVDADVSALLQREFRKRKIKMFLGRTLKDVRVEQGLAHGVVAPSPFVPATSAGVAEEAIEADMVLVTVGRASTTQDLGLATVGIDVDKRGWILVDDCLRTSVPGVYAIGDVCGPSRVMLAHVAAVEGLRVVDAVCGVPRPMCYDYVPAAIFTVPEIGSVGLSETQAKERGGRVACGITQMRELGKAQAMGELPGFFKVIVDADSGQLLGVHIVGAHASDLVAEAGLALSVGLNVHQLADTVHAHPTLAEGLYEAVRNAIAAMKTA
ncbi:MAG: dihydrolipoyl dehydrogenase [Desulfovibrio sp.]|nr:dihydrolipoyl dehydrogenase [Desulfovibrio sp.]